MLAHVAEETARLSHGFLGALFSVLIALEKAPWFATMSLCFWLFMTFVVNSFALHLFQAISKNDANSTASKVALIVVCYIFVIASLVLVLAAVTTPSPAFSDNPFVLPGFALFQFPNPIPVQVGIAIFALFTIITNMTGFLANQRSEKN